MPNWTGTVVAVSSGSPVMLGAWSSCPQYGEPVFRHPHWSRFAPLGPDAHMAIGAVMILITALAVIGNLLVLWVFCRNKRFRTPGNMLVNNLALSDAFMALTTFPLFIAASFCGAWPFGRRVCQVYATLSAFFGLMSMCTSATISFERYHVIASQRGPLKHTSKKQAVALIISVWLYALGWAVTPLLGWNEYILDGTDTSCSFNYLDRSTKHTSLIVSMCIGGFVAPLTITVVYYSKLYFRVKEHKREFASLCKQMHATVTEGGHKYKRRKVEFEIAKSMMICVFLFCLSWLPYAVISLIGQFGHRDVLTPVVATIPAVLAKASTVYNPFVYTLSHPRFRRKVPCARMQLKVSCYMKSTTDVISITNSRTSNSNAHAHLNRRLAESGVGQLDGNHKNDSIALQRLGDFSKSPTGDRGSLSKFDDKYDSEQLIKKILAESRSKNRCDISAPLVEQYEEKGSQA